MMERNYSIDILKGIGILLVLIGHSFKGTPIYNFIYSFHMPLFFIVSGYFFRTQVAKDLVKKDFNRLIVPILFMIGLMMIISCLCLLFSVETTKPDIILNMLGGGDIGAMWFLVALFLSRQVFNYLKKKYTDSTVLVVGVIMAVGGVYLSKYVYPRYYILEAVSAIVFLEIGALARKSDIDSFIKNTKWRIIMLLSILLWIYSTTFDSLCMHHLKWNMYIVPNIISASAGVWVVYQVSRFINAYTKYLRGFFLMCSCYTLPLLCWGPIKQYFLVFDELLPDGSLHLVYVFLAKILWALLTIYISVKIPLIKKVFQL